MAKKRAGEPTTERTHANHSDPRIGECRRCGTRIADAAWNQRWCETCRPVVRQERQRERDRRRRDARPRLDEHSPWPGDPYARTKVPTEKMREAARPLARQPQSVARALYRSAVSLAWAEWFCYKVLHQPELMDELMEEAGL